MKKLAILNQKKCDRSPFCPPKRVCPVKAIKKEKKSGFFGFGGKLFIDKSLCTGCKICVQYCPMGAITI
jgi:Fe-S-cluster-containing hydrogenase component 2